MAPVVHEPQHGTVRRTATGGVGLTVICTFTVSVFNACLLENLSAESCKLMVTPLTPLFATLLTGFIETQKYPEVYLWQIHRMGKTMTHLLDAKRNSPAPIY